MWIQPASLVDQRTSHTPFSKPLLLGYKNMQTRHAEFMSNITKYKLYYFKKASNKRR